MSRRLVLNYGKFSIPHFDSFTGSWHANNGMKGKYEKFIKVVTSEVGTERLLIEPFEIATTRISNIDRDEKSIEREAFETSYRRF